MKTSTSAVVGRDCLRSAGTCDRGCVGTKLYLAGQEFDRARPGLDEKDVVSVGAARLHAEAGEVELIYRRCRPGASHVCAGATGNDSTSIAHVCTDLFDLGKGQDANRSVEVALRNRIRSGEDLPQSFCRIGDKMVDVLRNGGESHRDADQSKQR